MTTRALPLRTLTLGAFALVLAVPTSTALGFSYIDLGLMKKSAQVDTSIYLNGGAQVDPVDSMVDTEVEIDAGTRVEVGEEGANDSATTSENTNNTEADVSVRLINVTRTEVDTEGDVIISLTPGEVDSEESLSAFASSTVSADANVQNLSFTDEVVEIVYTQKGRVLALMPVTFDVTARAFADGRVEVEYPWYSFLMADNRANVEASIQAAVNDVLSTTRAGVGENTEASAGANMQGKLSVQEAATLAATIRSVLMMSLGADAEAQVNEESGEVSE